MGRTDGAASDLHQLGFLGREYLVNLGDVLVGDGLDLRFCAAFFVLADHLFLQEFLDVVHGIAANIAHGNTPIFGFMDKFSKMPKITKLVFLALF